MPKILLVDNDVLLCELISDVLQLYGYQVHLASDAPEGWESFLAHAPEAVIVGHHLTRRLDSEETGLALAGRIKAASPNTPVLMASTEPPPEAEEVCDRVLRKPLTPTRLMPVLLELGVVPPATCPVAWVF